jgi:hypothetical protein
MAPHLVPFPAAVTLPCRYGEKTILRVSSSSGVGGVVVKPLLACRMSNGWRHSTMDVVDAVEG